ncbi:tannase/feruloyl esterase family alpha/beta hydrolase [Salipiger mangrovisoli]|uniref:Tannase/feruloyl esterase family alpha/beta hydrolase n=1 Tax=Salipiger mangrovisoli TaxID=2865933 RepID=A0ABR9XA56_9RHOB|nr:tannase/feruloyl esterase family alpha/beta hydrolase [Salipiger mangrovisoli]MBE9640366.1 tannase/feruloyl esterase family alpha/beta hydrolase [Salipiger mangrovisoli]
MLNRIGLVPGLLLVVMGSPLWSQTSEPDDFAASCSATVNRIISGVTVTGAETFTLEGSSYCVVDGTRAPFLDIELVIPKAWSGQLLQRGGGGFDGTIRSALSRSETGEVIGLLPLVADRGVAYVASNGGNRAKVEGEAAPQVWAGESPRARDSAIDYAYRATGTTIFFAKEAIAAVQGRYPEHSYFNGCSNGGRNAYIAAQRWPAEYDGIVAGCETMDMAGQTLGWLNIGRFDGTPGQLSPEQYSFAYREAVAACDEDDGLRDGIIANPRACEFRPAELACDTKPTDLCLSPEQVATLDTLLSDVELDGQVVYKGYNWADLSSYGPRYNQLASGFALIATGDAGWLTPEYPRAFDPEHDSAPLSLAMLRSGTDQDLIGVAQYVAGGGKLLSWHGNSDGLLSPNAHAAKHAEMLDLARELGMETPREGAMFFTVAGSNHNGAGDMRGVDWFTAISDWAEKGRQPAGLTYTFEDASGPRSIPICEYPAFPRYSGTGDPAKAENFACTAP